jgi:hypothetical protein
MCRWKSIKAIDVFVGFLDFFWTIETVRESLGPEVLYLFYMRLFCLWWIEMLYLIYLFLLLQQVCMCDQLLVLDLLRSGNTTLGVLWFILSKKNGGTFVGGILKLIGKITIHT